MGAGGSHIPSMVIYKISHFQGTNEEILSHFLFLIILYHKNFFKSTFCRNMSFFRIFDDFQRFLAIFEPFLANFDQFLTILSHFSSFLRILGRDFSPFAAFYQKFSKIFQNFAFHLVFIGVTNRFISSDRQQIKLWSRYNQFFFWG